jgi:hypothetical protein
MNKIAKLKRELNDFTLSFEDEPLYAQEYIRDLRRLSKKVGFHLTYMEIKMLDFLLLSIKIRIKENTLKEN